MFPIAVLVRGSHIFGNGEGVDVDLFIPYLSDSSVVFRGVQQSPVTLVDGNLDYLGLEVGVVCGKLLAGDSETLISIMSPGILAHTHWYYQLRSVIQNNLSLVFADSFVKYVQSLIERDETPSPYDYQKAAQFIQLAKGYFSSTALSFDVVDEPKGGFTGEWYTSEMVSLKKIIEEAKDLKYEGSESLIFDHSRFANAVNQWLVGTRSQVFKIEDGVF